MDSSKTDEIRQKDEHFRSPTPLTRQTNSRQRSSSSRARLATLAQIGEDWLYLALLGIIMALLSFSMDSIITLFLSTRLLLFNDISDDNIFVQYLSWCITPIVLVSFSSAFVHLCSPTAIGSGIPEMKTILRGVVLNEYLTFRTLVAKIVGLTFTLGSGLPLGKEGPFVHMASIVATLLSKLVASFQGIYENESRTSEMLSAACAVGVAATFYAPIGGVLFSIEVTTVYFAVRNYWRGFFAACCGATVWRLLGFWIKNDESISALFKTNFRTDYPFDPVELLMFSFIGITCGLAGAAYIKFHREIVQFFRRHKKISGFLQKNRLIYPIFVTLIITTVTFPPFLGKYTASTLSTHTTIEHMFSNRTWSLGSQDLASKRILDEWTTPDTSFHLHLVLYIAMLFWTSALASTIPIPSGLFIPVLKMGAAYGRLLGELMHSAFPKGVRYGGYVHPAAIVPGCYAVVGAAAFSGAVTHTISTSVILFEMTGQIVHIIPVILGVLIANAVCQSLQPSIYDSIIEIKKLPYLPPIASSNSISHKIIVKEFMNTNLAYVWKEKCTYRDLKALLVAHKKIRSFPLVDSQDSMKLLGSIARSDLLKLLYLHLGRERRLQEVFRRNSDTSPPGIRIQAMIGDSLSRNQSKGDGYVLSRSEIPDQVLEFGSKFSISSEASDLSCTSLSDKQLTGVSFERVKDPEKRIQSVYSSAESETKTIFKSTEIIGSESQERPKDQKFESSSSDDDESCPKEVQTAKIVNQYNRGSLMDDEALDISNTKFKNCLDTMNDSIEVVTVSPPPTNADCPKKSSANSVSTGTNISHPISEPNNQASKSGIPNLQGLSAPIPLTPVIELKINSNSNIHQSLMFNSRPTKSILKTSSSSSFSNMYKRNISTQSFSSALSNNDGKIYGPSSRVGGLQSRLSVAQTDDNGHTWCDRKSALSDDRTLEQASVKPRRKVRLPQLRVVDMTPEEQEQWEKEQLGVHVDLSRCQIDEAPFQLVEQTSLYRVHTLFSMLGLNHAYVTSFGRLVGVVALKDIRFSIEKMLQEK